MKLILIRLNKKKLIFSLVIIAIILLIGNMLIEYVKKPARENLSGIAKFKIENKLLKVLDGYAIEHRWIEKKLINNRNYDSLQYIYFIKIPSDIPIPLIIRDLDNEFKNENIRIISKEKKNFGNTSVKIYSNHILKLWANFIVDSKIKRPYSKISFLIKGINNLSKQQVERLINFPYPLTFVISPSNSMKKYLSEIKAVGKEFCILLNDNISNEEYKISPGFSKNRLKASVISIFVAFKKAKEFFFDPNSQMYKSVIFNFIKDEFAKRNIKLKSINIFPYLSGNNYNNLISKFIFFEKSSVGKKKRTLLLNANALLILHDELQNYIKKGNKIVPFK